MPIKFDFISPDIVVNEVDESVLPPEPTDDGVLIIGQAPMGPTMKPVKIRNIADLENVFGVTDSGNGASDDIWRNGNNALPTYGLYAAKAWLASQTSPVTYVRLAGEDLTSTTKAGWNFGGAAATDTADPSTHNLAYGLWIFPSASQAHVAGSEPHFVSGTLGAIIYTKGAALTLRGNAAVPQVDTEVSKVGYLIQSNASATGFGAFELEVHTGPSTSQVKSFHMNAASNGFIREKLNTDPQKLESGQKSSDENYFVGETFETAVFENLNTAGSASAGQQYGLLLPLMSGSDGAPATNNWIERNRAATAAKTGYFIQNYPSGEPNSDFNKNNLKKLFRLCSLHEGEHFQKNYYVEVQLSEFQSSPNDYSSFKILIKNVNGDKLEEYVCNLNPDSDDFISKKIGDQYLEYSSAKRKFITKGDYPNISSLVRVELSGEYKSVAKNTIPFGFYGPYAPKGFFNVSGAATYQGGEAYAGLAGSGSLFGGRTNANNARIQHGVNKLVLGFQWPKLQVTDGVSNSANGRKLVDGEALGIRHYRSTSGDLGSQPIFDKEKSGDFVDLLRNYQEGISPHSSGGNLEPLIFSLDDVKELSAGSEEFGEVSGSHIASTSWTSNHGTKGLITAASSSGHIKLVAPFFGGFEGVDIQYVDPFSKSNLPSGATKLNRYTYSAIDKVLDFTGDAEFLQYDLISMPGIVNEKLVKKLALNTQLRADALAVIDINSGFKGKHEDNDGDTLGTVSAVETQMESLRFNNSYAAAYYPEICIRDNGKVIVPASIAGIGAIAKSEAATGAPWFAPAGFNRGGISVLGGPAGPVVAAPAETLTKSERDTLYAVNVNPIANFPGEGPVVFGQKTLQRTKSALDRINVRRLLIYLKKRIGVIARTILFDANIEATWNRFVSQATPILADAQAGFGIAEYKLVLDETTTTPDYVDRNIMYAKIFIKPAYAIEFIAIDFVITRSGIEF